MSRSKVSIPIDRIADAVRGRKVGVFSNGGFWLEDAHDDLINVVKAVAAETVILYGEHGVRGDEAVKFYNPNEPTFDAHRQCAVRDLYGCYDPRRRLAMAAPTLGDLDLVLIGMHDIGCRHYSYKWTMSHLLDMAAALGKPVTVVDAPNPVRGDLVEGNLPDPQYRCVVCDDSEQKSRLELDYTWLSAPLTYRHGMTMGEMARLCRAHRRLDLDLRVIPLQGWRRDLWWDQTGLPYVNFDPSIYSAETCLGFLCTGLFQGTNVSWGMGTADPFRIIGAPWMKDDRLLHALLAHDLAGVTWTRAYFTPRWADGAGDGWRRFNRQECQGVRLHVTDRNRVCTAAVQLTLLRECCRLYPDEFVIHLENERFNVRLQDTQWVPRIRSDEPVAAILAEWQTMSAQFQEMRRPFLLY